VRHTRSILWAGPPLMMRPCTALWVWGYTPTTSPERLVSDEQRRLKLVWAVQRASELLNTKSELLKQVFEQFNRSLNPDLLDAEVCQNDARGSRYLDRCSVHTEVTTVMAPTM
jgi:hypothetical protein